MGEYRHSVAVEIIELIVRVSPPGSSGCRSAAAPSWGCLRPTEIRPDRRLGRSRFPLLGQAPVPDRCPPTNFATVNSDPRPNCPGHVFPTVSPFHLVLASVTPKRVRTPRDSGPLELCRLGASYPEGDHRGRRPHGGEPQSRGPFSRRRVGVPALLPVVCRPLAPAAIRGGRRRAQVGGERTGRAGSAPGGTWLPSRNAAQTASRSVHRLTLTAAAPTECQPFRTQRPPARSNQTRSNQTRSNQTRSNQTSRNQTSRNPGGPV